jgi:predicted 3-demethylubiquinone-9 3-methyltransferase (glyoxalase superfamily)
MSIIQKIVPCLWFDDQAEPAAKFYIGIEALSLQVYCETQADVDHFWTRLGQDGDPKAQQCGWLKDRFGVSWQVVPTALITMMTDPDPAKTQRVMTALLKMKKLDIPGLQRAFAG